MEKKEIRPDFDPVIPLEMMPPKGMEEVLGQDGKHYLLKNDVMFTAYKHSRGEFSEFFLSLRDRCLILGNRCPKCKQLICPPFQQRCPECNFTEMKSEVVPDTGIMAASPVIAFFAPARFKKDVPYATGDVYLGKSDTTLSMRLRTTKGMLRKPEIFKRGTPVKVVFRDDRNGEILGRSGDILDIFAVPQAELTEKQIKKSPLFESELSWEGTDEPEFKEPDEKVVRKKEELIKKMEDLSVRIQKSQRAQKDLANWMRKVRVKTGGGIFGVLIDDGNLAVIDEDINNPDLVLAIADPGKLLDWFEKGDALTNLVIEGDLWVNKSELETITRLDRVRRSLRRDNI